MASDADSEKFLWNNFTNATSTTGYMAGGRASGGVLPVDSWKAIVSSVLLLICIGGIIGNCCVIVVIARYAKTKTVTNLYIANLAVADLCFLVGVPFLVATSIMERWVFGDLVCRLFFVSTSINWFASVFILTVMSVDRYLAVCWPVASLRYRTLAIARVVCACVWTASILAMLPVMLYATAAERPGPDGGQTCTMRWPHGTFISPENAFMWYGFLLGFAGPVALISVFYALVVFRLRRIAANRISQSHKAGALTKSHARVTALVLTVIAVYVCCWLPYWVFQVSMSLMTSLPTLFLRAASHVVTMLSYANSMLNPLLYAAFNENFRVGFARACRCLRGGDGGGGNLTTGRGGGQSMTGRNATVQNRLRLATTSYEGRKSVAGQRIELVEVVAVSSRTAKALDEVAMTEDAKLAEGGDCEFDALVTQPCSSTSAVVVANNAVSTADHPVEETRM